MNTIKIIMMALAIFSVFIAYMLTLDFIKNRGHLEPASYLKAGATGFIGNFFDALGIGSFAIITALLKIFKQVRDIDIPGTLNVGCAIPSAAETIIYMQIIKVDITTLVLMILSACAGALIGAGIVTKLSEHKIQLAIGAALLITALLMFAGKMHWMPSGGSAISLTGNKLIIGLIGNFIIGSLISVGIGFFAPCMALVYFLGLSPQATFPIMMGSSASVILVVSAKFIRARRYNCKASLSIAIFGVAGVMVAAYIVKHLPTNLLQWLVIGVILYTSTIMLLSARKRRSEQGNMVKS